MTGLDLFETAQRDLLAQAGRSPARSVVPEMGESFSAALDDTRRSTGILSRWGNEADFVQERLDAFEQRTGERIVNPIVAGTPGPELALMLRGARDRFSAKAKELGDDGLAFPTDQEISAGGLALAKRARARVGELAQGAQGPGAYAGGIAANLYGGLTDPLNAISIAATPVGGPILTGMLRAGLGMAAQQTAAEALTFGYQRQIDPEHGVGAALASVAEAGVGGALFEGGIRGIGALWRRYRTLAPEIAAAQPLEVRDAGTVMERAADLEANNPFKTGLSGQAAHAEAIAKVEGDLLSGRAPAVPEAAGEEGGARTGSAFYPGGRVDVRYQLAELSDLVTSHDADFRVRPDYPPELQPRDRSSAVARDQVQRIYSDFQPERLGPNPEANAGAPIVGPGGIVESGNGRALALSQVYAEDGSRAGRYRAFLESQGYDTSDFRQPVLVARRVTDMDPDARASFAHATNGSAALRMSTTEQALSDARHIDDGLSALLKAPEIGAAANRDFVRSFVAKLPEGERGGVLTKAGGLSANGVKRVQAALVARAYGDADVVARAFDHPDPNIKAIAGALTDAAPAWVNLRAAVTRGEIAGGHDITDDVVTAVKAIMRARDEGRPVWEVLHQGDMFASDMAGMAARLFFRDGDAMTKPAARKAVAEALTTFAEESQKNLAAGRLFADSVEPADVLRTATQRSTFSPAAIAEDAGRAPSAAAASGDLAPATAQLIQDALRPENIDKAMTSPAVRDAATKELDRLLEIEGFKDRPVPIAEHDGQGGVKWRLGSIEDALREVDSQLALAAEVRACAAPSPVGKAA